MKAAIPTPPAGYWTQVRAGRDAARTPLPPRPLGMSCLVGPVGQRHRAAKSLDLAVERRMAPDPNWSRARARNFMVPRFANLLRAARGRRHPLIKARLQRDRELRLQAGPERLLLPFEKPFFGSRLEKRRLFILNRLILICEAEGARFSLTGWRADLITATINHVAITLQLEEMGVIQRAANSAKRSGGNDRRLALMVVKRPGSPGRIWQDLDDSRMEAQLPAIASELFVLAEERYRHRLEGEQAWRVAARLGNLRSAEAHAAEREQERRASEEAVENMRIQRLLAEARAFHDAQLIKTYVDHLRAHSPEMNETAFEQWARWAMSVATPGPV